ncbi:MAG: hypothetical protein AAGD25_39460 [Cyanobacteria bacterium P01_F01_bin.150]
MTDFNSTRLDRLESLAESIMLATRENQRQIDQNQQQINQNQQQIQQHQRLIAQQQQEISQNSRDIRESMVDVIAMIATLGQQIEENSVYIRGLQSENRNILNVLMGQRGEGDGETERDRVFQVMD